MKFLPHGEQAFILLSEQFVIILQISELVFLLLEPLAEDDDGFLLSITIRSLCISVLRFPLL